MMACTVAEKHIHYYCLDRHIVMKTSLLKTDVLTILLHEWQLNACVHRPVILRFQVIFSIVGKKPSAQYFSVTWLHLTRNKLRQKYKKKKQKKTMLSELCYPSPST